MADEARRHWLKAALAGAGGLILAACSRTDRQAATQSLLAAGEAITHKVHRTIIPRSALAREFAPSSISSDFKANGTIRPQTPEYLALVADGFMTWRLLVDGLVDRPLALDLGQLRGEPARTQITRHDCVEGWSGIAQWSGARLGPLLDKAGLKPNARYVVFHCADDLAGSADGRDRYYESIDLVDAYHPQTILAYDMNGAPLGVPHGAPVRLRVERQLGYKQAKYVMRIEVVESLAHIGAGRGGFWEDRGYDWYAGV
jgi:DMSO/TMAO reductase YedYZ molybdopterin-dependent catalytic subunit